MAITAVRPGQKVARGIVFDLFRNRFGVKLGHQFATAFTQKGRRSLLRSIDDSEEVYRALVRRILVNSDIEVRALNGNHAAPAVITKLENRQRRCRSRMDHLRITTPFLRGKREKDDLLLLTNRAYIVAEEVELYALTRFLARLGRPSRSC